MFAVERSSVTPDLLVTSKSLGGGFPIGAVTGRAELMDTLKPGELGATFGGNPVACATALATIAVIERDGLLARAEVIGQAIRKRFVAMPARPVRRRSRSRARARGKAARSPGASGTRSM